RGRPRRRRRQRGDGGGRMTRPLRAGLIGLGAMGRNHARVLGQLEGVDLVGVADALATDAGTAHGAPVVGSVEELLAMGVDYAVVASPTGTHEEVGLQLAEAGV